MSAPAILCVSANPALDRRLRVGSLLPGDVNRARHVQLLPGGKAAHVAMAARALGARTAWIGLLGGRRGKELADALRNLGIEVFPIESKAATRTNLEIIEDSGRITEVLEPGGPVSPHEHEEMTRIFMQGLREEWPSAAVVISGSIPSGVPPNFYAMLIESARAAGSKVFLDASGDALRLSLAARPDFVKPNRKEAEALLGHPLDHMQAAGDAAQEIIDRGARSAAITLGSEGLIWLEKKEGPAWIARPPRLNAISTVGCGDTTMAGFAYAMLQGWSAEKTTRFAAACGAANCLTELTGRISAAEVESLAPRIDVQGLPLSTL